MRETFAVLAILLVLAGGVQASLIEDTTPITYQNDDRSGQDAADTCLEAAAGEEDDVRLSVDGGPHDGEGQLVPIDDEEDHWLMPIQDVPPDGTVTVSVETKTPLPLVENASTEVILMVFDPQCELVGAEATVLGGQATVTVDIAETGDYRASTITEPLVSPPEIDLGATPTAGHCAPSCVYAYQMAAFS